METSRSLRDQALRGILVPALVLVAFSTTAAASSAHDVTSRTAPSAHHVRKPWLYETTAEHKKPWLYSADVSGRPTAEHKKPWLY